MNPLNPFAVSGLIIAAFYFPLAFFIFIKGKTTTARIYSAYLFVIGLWGAGVILIGTINELAIIKWIWKATYSFVLFIPPLFYHSVYLIRKQKSKWELIFVYTQTIFFIILIYTDHMLSEHRFMFDQFYFHIATPSFTLSFILWLLIISAGHFIFLREFNKMFSAEKSQFKNIVVLTFIGFVGGIMNFFPAYGWDIYPWGNFLAIAPCLAISHAIFKYQFLDIRVVIRKSLVYSILILFTALLYFLLILFIEKFLQGLWGYKSFTIRILTAFAVGVMFFPLHNYIQRLVDKLIFKKTAEEISKENDLLLSEVEKTEKLKSVAVLASGLAHEIRNPLTALRTFTEYLPKRLDDKEFLKDFSKIVGKEVTRIDRLVTELLEFAKPSPVNLRPTNINKLIKETLDLLSNKFIEQRIRLDCDLDPACGADIPIDPNKIKQAVLNIVLNAVEAMKDGGTLTVKTALIAPDSPNGPGGGGISISFSDTGCGMPQDVQKQIFDPFFSTKDSGTGLGLPVTYGIIQEHGGMIHVASQEGNGTNFTIILPAKLAPPGTTQ